MHEGEQLKLDGMSATLAKDSAVHRGYAPYAREVLDRLIDSGQRFTADDVRAGIPEGIEAHSPNVLPSVIGMAARQGRIVPAGFVNSHRPSRHAGRLMVWIAA